ncbi:MAG: AAA family ATPase [Bacteroidetes bacterium HGW-Bacteroidetes-6]|nr:MAG: AAA family ATPase [Bacteroidetes bacterium HGW-Bacteroidetes-6]
MRSYASDVEATEGLKNLYKLLKDEVAKVIVGQDEVIDKVLISILSKGHALLIGVPGLAKTLMITTIAKSLGLSFSRIQFTPDLMPSDIIGTEILGEDRQFRYIKGPIFSHIVLADEVNRTPPKTQSALLEAMQEREVSVAGVSHKLPDPFFVLATQNPIEQEGTYPLPEAQLDRFMFSIWLDYPSMDEEIEVVKRTTLESMPEASVVTTKEELIYFQNLVRRVPVNDNVLRYAVSLTAKTRPGTNSATADSYIAWGAGPRSSQYLILGAKCHALLHGKYSPDIEDVQAVAENVLQHRIVKNYKAEAEGLSSREIIRKLQA